MTAAHEYGYSSRRPGGRGRAPRNGSTHPLTCGIVLVHGQPGQPGQNGHRDVAQLGSALDWGSRGRRFKSCRPDLLLCRSEVVSLRGAASSACAPVRREIRCLAGSGVEPACVPAACRLSGSSGCGELSAAAVSRGPFAWRWCRAPLGAPCCADPRPPGRSWIPARDANSSPFTANCRAVPRGVRQHPGTRCLVAGEVSAADRVGGRTMAVAHALCDRTATQLPVKSAGPYCP